MTMQRVRRAGQRAGLAGKLFILWLLGVPLGILLLIFVVAKIF